MKMIIFFVPVTHIEIVKNALFLAGAGRYHSYDCCSWQVLGEGQFRPLKGSKPFIGKIGEGIEKVAEYKVEMICEESRIPTAISALKKAHPYEEPAYAVWSVSTNF